MSSIPSVGLILIVLRISLFTREGMEEVNQLARLNDFTVSEFLNTIKASSKGDAGLSDIVTGMKIFCVLVFIVCRIVDRCF